MATMNVSLPDQMKDWVESRSADGTYANSSDYIRDLIRQDQDRANALKELKDAIAEGEASGDPIVVDFEDFKKRARARYEQKNGAEACL